MFNPRVAYVGFVADKVALALAFLRLLQFSPAHCNSISVHSPIRHPGLVKLAHCWPKF
jgi:hypothetical protein